MIAVDTNILVYSHRRDSPWHARAARCVRLLAEGHAAWAIPWPCIYEFIGIVTHPRIYQPPSKLSEALAQADAWLESPSLTLLAEPEAGWPAIRACLAKGSVAGPQVHDARVVGLCLAHGVRELWTADRDFSRFSALRTRNPLAE